MRERVRVNAIFHSRSCSLWGATMPRFGFRKIDPLGRARLSFDHDLDVIMSELLDSQEHLIGLLDVLEGTDPDPVDGLAILEPTEDLGAQAVELGGHDTGRIWGRERPRLDIHRRRP